MASTTEARGRVVIYIDGKEIPNQVKSIRSELAKITNEQNKMTIGSKEYVAAGQNIKKLKGILAEHNEALKVTESGWKKLLTQMGGVAGGIGMYQLASRGLSMVTGFVKDAIKSAEEFEVGLANLSALTGLTGKDLEWMGKKADELATTTTKDGVIITASSVEILNAFKLVGSAKPELLKNKDALAEVTKQILILKEASGNMDLETTTKSVTSIMNEFSMGADQARRVINVLGAGAKEGAGEIDFIADAITRIGPIANTAGVSLEMTVSILEKFAEKGMQAEKSGISLRNILIKLQEDTKNYKNGVFDINTAMENLKAIQYDTVELAKQFGTENVTGAQVMAQNTEEIQKFTTAITGTEVAYQQAVTNSNTAVSRHKQITNELAVSTKNFGQAIMPIWEGILSVASGAMNGITNLFKHPLSSLMGQQVADYRKAIDEIKDMNGTTTVSTKFDNSAMEAETKKLKERLDRLKEHNNKKTAEGGGEKNNDAEKRLKEIENLNKKINELNDQQSLKEASDKSKEIASANNKYRDLYNLANKYGQDTTELDELYKNEMVGIDKKYATLEREQYLKDVEAGNALAIEADEQELDRQKNTFEGKVAFLNKQEQIEVAQAENSITNETELARKKLQIQIKYLEEKLKLIQQQPEMVGDGAQQEIQLLLETIKKLKAELNAPVRKDFLGLSEKELQKILRISDAVKSMIASIGDLKLAQIQNEQDAEDAAFEQEKKRIENSLDTEEEKQKQLDELTLAHKKRVYEMDLKEWQTKRDFALAQAIIDTAGAVIKAISNEDYIGAVTAGALGAAAIALILTAKKPAAPYAMGGGVPGTGDGDTVPAMLTPGEYVTRKPVVQKLGTRFFDILNSNPTSPNIEGAIASLGERRAGASAGSYGTATAGNNTIAAAGNSNQALIQVVNKLLARLDQPIKAKAYYGQDETLKLRKEWEKLDKLESDLKK